MEEIKRLRFDEIPKRVLVEVREKWRDTLEDGWSEDVWTECAMCGYIWNLEGFLYCDACPCVAHEWCFEGEPYRSRLHLVYHEFNWSRWEEDVRRFIEMLDVVIDDLDRRLHK